MKTTIFSTTALSLLAGLLIASTTAISDDDDDSSSGKQLSVGVAMKKNPMYEEECGSCHMAYPPGLLPDNSWHKIMAGLEDHFDDNAELDTETNQQISAFLTKNSADKSAYRRSKQIMRGMGHQSPMRITELSYFKREHREISPKLLKRSEVTSLSHCNSCHQKAEKGSFSENEIFIKGIGRWDD